MAQLDQIFVTNPTETDFEVRFDGEVYYLKAGEEAYKPQHLARHMAKHLTDRMMAKAFYEEEARLKRKKENISDAKKVQMTMYDTPARRIALYQVLRSEEEVLEVLKSYPQFKAKFLADGSVEYSLTGEIDEYHKFVENFNKKEEPQVEGTPATSEKPKKVASKKAQA